MRNKQLSYPAAPPQADRDRLQAAVAAAAEFGPYFSLHGNAPAALSRAQLYEPRHLHSLLRAVGDRIGTDEDRVAASTLQYGFAARCWSLVLGAWRCGGVVIDLRGLRYVVNPSGSIDLTLNDFRGWDCTSLSPDEVVQVIAGTVIADQLTGLHTALGAVVRIADGLLWGNAASALFSAARKVTAERPGGQFAAVTTALLSHAPLADRIVSTSGGGARRNSCCLWYRTRDRTTCGDCPLSERPVLRK